MDRSALFKLADRALGGTLEQRLRTYAAAGVPRRAAARLINAELGVDINPQTIQRWMQDIVEEDEPNGDEEAA